MEKSNKRKTFFYEKKERGRGTVRVEPGRERERKAIQTKLNNIEFENAQSKLKNHELF